MFVFFIKILYNIYKEVISMDQEKVGKFITYLRKEKNISQEDLAQRLYLSRQAISKWERGKALPDASNL